MSQLGQTEKNSVRANVFRVTPESGRRSMQSVCPKGVESRCDAVALGSNISVSAPFVRRCLTGSTMSPFSHPAHRTGQADFPHPALGQDFTLARATPSAASEHLSELIGFPISRSFTTYCVCLELRSLPSTGITRLQRYYEPLRHPRAPSLSLTASCWSPLTTPWGFPCCVRFPCVHAAANTPVQQLGVIFAQRAQPFQPSPIWQSGRPTPRPFRGLLSVHSRCGLHTRAVTNS